MLRRFIHPECAAGLKIKTDCDHSYCKRKIIMRISKPGKVRKGLWCLGRKESCIYLLEGRDESLLISGGMSYIVPEVIHQLKEFDINRERIKKLLILHAHFDHIGIVPFFKRSHPDLNIYASARAWEILKMSKAISTINDFSRELTKRMKMVEACSTYDLDWRDDISGMIVSEGDKIRLGNMDVQILETPGHSSCSISAYVPQIKTLFPSDGGGVPYRETIITPGNSNYTKFQQSLEKLKGLDVEYFCADHYGYVSGEEAKNFISHAIKLAKECRTKMEKVYARSKDINQAAKELTDSFYSGNSDYLLTPEIFKVVHSQMLRHIANEMEGE